MTEHEIKFADWFAVPPIFRRDLRHWFDHGILPIDRFLQALLCNDLRTALRHAVPQQKEALPALVAFLEKHAPLHAWGNSDEVANWHYVGGLEGRRRFLADLQGYAS